MTTRTIDNGYFITFEGPEGAGKSTQLKFLESFLASLGYDVLTTREPGGTDLGEKLRSLLMEFQKEEITAEAELLLFSASRVQHVQRVILPHLRHGGIVLCDRFTDSTMAYQGYARGLSKSVIAQLNDYAMCGRHPDMTLVFDLPVEVGLARTRSRAQGAVVNDRIEAEGLAFHRAVREGFLDIARKEPGRVKVIDASRSAEQVQQAVAREVCNALD